MAEDSNKVEMAFELNTVEAVAEAGKLDYSLENLTGTIQGLMDRAAQAVGVMDGYAQAMVNMAREANVAREAIQSNEEVMKAYRAFGLTTLSDLSQAFKDFDTILLSGAESKEQQIQMIQKLMRVYKESGASFDGLPEKFKAIIAQEEIMAHRTEVLSQRQKEQMALGQEMADALVANNAKRMEMERFYTSWILTEYQKRVDKEKEIQKNRTEAAGIGLRPGVSELPGFGGIQSAFNTRQSEASAQVANARGIELSRDALRDYVSWVKTAQAEEKARADANIKYQNDWNEALYIEEQHQAEITRRRQAAYDKFDELHRVSKAGSANNGRLRTAFEDDMNRASYEVQYTEALKKTDEALRIYIKDLKEAEERQRKLNQERDTFVKHFDAKLVSGVDRIAATKIPDSVKKELQDQFTASMQAASGMRSYTDATKAVNEANRQLSIGLRLAREDVAKMAEEQKKASHVMDTLKAVAERVIYAFVAYKLLSEIQELFRKFISITVEMAAKIDLAYARVRGLSSSLHEAGEVMKTVMAVATQVPYTFEEITKSAVILQARGLKPTSDVLRVLSATSLALDKPLEGIVDAFSKLQSGAATTERFLKPLGIGFAEFQIAVGHSATRGEALVEILSRNLTVLDAMQNTLPSVTKNFDTLVGQMSLPYVAPFLDYIKIELAKINDEMRETIENREKLNEGGVAQDGQKAFFIAREMARLQRERDDPDTKAVSQIKKAEDASREYLGVLSDIYKMGALTREQYEAQVRAEFDLLEAKKRAIAIERLSRREQVGDRNPLSIGSYREDDAAKAENAWRLHLKQEAEAAKNKQNLVDVENRAADTLERITESRHEMTLSQAKELLALRSNHDLKEIDGLQRQIELKNHMLIVEKSGLDLLVQHKSERKIIIDQEMRVLQIRTEVADLEGLIVAEREKAARLAKSDGPVPTLIKDQDSYRAAQEVKNSHAEALERAKGKDNTVPYLTMVGQHLDENLQKEWQNFEALEAMNAPIENQTALLIRIGTILDAIGATKGRLATLEEQAAARQAREDAKTQARFDKEDQFTKSNANRIEALRIQQERYEAKGEEDKLKSQAALISLRADRERLAVNKDIQEVWEHIENRKALNDVAGINVLLAQIAVLEKQLTAINKEEGNQLSLNSGDEIERHIKFFFDADYAKAQSGTDIALVSLGKFTDAIATLDGALGSAIANVASFAQEAFRIAASRKGGLSAGSIQGNLAAGGVLAGASFALGRVMSDAAERARLLAEYIQKVNAAYERRRQIEENLKDFLAETDEEKYSLAQAREQKEIEQLQKLKRKYEEAFKVWEEAVGSVYATSSKSREMKELDIKLLEQENKIREAHIDVLKAEAALQKTLRSERLSFMDIQFEFNQTKIRDQISDLTSIIPEFLTASFDERASLGRKLLGLHRSALEEENQARIDLEQEALDNRLELMKRLVEERLSASFLIQSQALRLEFQGQFGASKGNEGLQGQVMADFLRRAEDLQGSFDADIAREAARLTAEQEALKGNDSAVQKEINDKMLLVAKEISDLLDLDVFRADTGGGLVDISDQFAQLGASLIDLSDQFNRFGSSVVDMTGRLNAGFNIPALSWSTVVQPLSWSTVVPALNWSTAIPSLDWSTKVASLDWSTRVAPLNWAQNVTPLNWETYVAPLGTIQATLVGGFDPVITAIRSLGTTLATTGVRIITTATVTPHSGTVVGGGAGNGTVGMGGSGGRSVVAFDAAPAPEPTVNFGDVVVNVTQTTELTPARVATIVQEGINTLIAKSGTNLVATARGVL